MNKSNNNKVGLELGQLIDNLKKKDTHYANLSKMLQTFYWILIPIYLFIAIMSFIESGDISESYGFVCFAIGMLIFAVFFRKYYKEYRDVDYSQPTAKMLKYAVWRYKPFQLRTLWLLVALVFFDLGMSFNNVLNLTFDKMQLYFWGTMILSTIIGLIIWYFRYRPLWKNASSLLKDIEGV